MRSTPVPCFARTCTPSSVRSSPARSEAARATRKSSSSIPRARGSRTSPRRPPSIAGRSSSTPALPFHFATEEASMNELNRRRLEVTSVFLKIGALGYGAAAIWGLIQAEVQERRAWLTKERYLEGMALVNVLPGAPAMQMCIFVGHERAGWWGGVLGGLAFMAPAFAIMLALSVVTSAFGGLPLMRDAFYGLGPVVLGVFIVAIYRLGRTAIRDLASSIIALAAAAAAALSLIGGAGSFLLAGCAGVAAAHSAQQGA